MGRMLKISDEKCNFKMRVSGVLIHDNKVLTTEMDNSGFLCLPGGHIDLGEDSITAVLREMHEEVKYDIKLEKCIAVVENFFTNKKNRVVHEVAFYYLLKLNNPSKIDLNDYEFIECDCGGLIKHKFKWVDLADIVNENFKPMIIKEKLSKKDFSFEHIIYKEDGYES